MLNARPIVSVLHAMTTTRTQPTRKAGGVLDPLARLWLARAAREVMRVARRSARGRNGFWLDDDACDELGLASYDSTRFDARFKDIERLIRRIEKNRPPRDGAAFRIADLIGGPLDLSLVERDTLALALLHWHEAVFNDLLQEHVRTLARFARVAGPIIGVSGDTLLLALDGKGTLARCHLVKTDGFRGEGALMLHTGLKSLLRRPPKTADDAMRAFVTHGKPSALSLDDVEHVRRDVDIAVALMRGAIEKKTPGVNILLYGPPGTGKTETARLIAQGAGASLGEVPVATDDHEKIGFARLGSYAFCQRLLASSERGAVLFDEIEDVLPRNAFAALWGVAESREDKGFFVRTLEENPVPALWTTNHVDHIDPALLRRFDLVLSMRVPPERIRRRAVDQHLEGLPVSERARALLAADERLAPAVVERAARVVSLGGIDDVEGTVHRIVDNTLKIVAGPKRTQAPALPFPYDLAYANASVDLDKLARTIAGGRGVRVCLYGPPGSGKTAFIKHAAERAHKRIIIKRMSDLLSPWVGQTEQNIAAMFDEARDEDAVLFVDEADGILRERAAAERSWELTQTNELLVQMEAFDGVFACATNLVGALDAAAFRRFDVKVRFDPLSPVQRRSLFATLARAVGAADAPGDGAPGDGALDDVTAHRLDRLNGLCAGHFAAVARRAWLLLDAPRCADLAGGLEEEQRFIKGGAKVGFVA